MKTFIFGPLQNCPKISDLSTDPGVYIWGFKNPDRPFKPYYVGKASNLRQRLRSELIRQIEFDFLNHFPITLHKKVFFEDPDKKFIFRRIANPGRHCHGIKIDDYQNLVFYNHSDFLKQRYFDSIKEISDIDEKARLKFEDCFNQTLGAEFLANNLLNGLNYSSLPTVFQEFLDVYNSYIQNPITHKISDRLMFTSAEIPSGINVETNNINLRTFETILKFSLIDNVGSQSGIPPQNEAKKIELEGIISFDGPDEIGKLFHQRNYPELDRLYTWRR